MKKVLIGIEARKSLKRGIDLCADVVKVSMGGNGRNVAIYNGYTTEVINDGVSIAKEINVTDESLQAGIQLAKQCAEQTNRDAGDGTTTTIVLLQAILKEIITDLQTVSPRKLRETLYAEADAVLGRMKIKQIETKEDMYNIALTSCLDEEIAKVLSDAFDKLGKDMKVTVEEVDKTCLELSIVEGMQFEAKSLSGSILQNVADEKVELSDVDVMYVKKAETIDSIQERLSKVVDRGGKSLVIIANQFSRPVLLAMMAPDFKFYPIENREMNNGEDIPAFVGEVPVDKVIIEKGKITLIGGKGERKAHIESLKKKREELESDYDKEVIDKRIASLDSGIALVKIGRATDVERSEAVLKIEDAVNAVKGALDAGYVKGGGIALMDASKGGILEKIGASPYNQIILNGGDKEIPETVIDSFKSVKFSFLNALSTACSILTVEAALIEEKEKDEEC